MRKDGLASASSAPPEFDITAVVTVTDDGGSSGRLRRDFDVLPPGDIRNCLVALSGDDALLSQLFQYRFPAGRGLKGHSFGNLFLTALTNVTGDFAHAVKVSSEILASAGRIYPSTAANVRLKAILEDCSTVLGETQISRSKARIKKIELVPATCKPLLDTLLAMSTADLITMGPGSLFTSIVPNLLVDGIPLAIRRSYALKACFVNLMSQPGETTGFTASDHVCAINDHAGMNLLDVVVVNTGPIPRALKRRYAAERATPVENDADELEKLGVRVMQRDLVARSEKVRHDSDALALVVAELAAEGRRKREAKERR
jgi:uncharacterized cofD-like protein